MDMIWDKCLNMNYLIRIIDQHRLPGKYSYVNYRNIHYTYVYLFDTYAIHNTTPNIYEHANTFIQSWCYLT